MNKLHNFSFVGEFPMFNSPECPKDQKKNLQYLSQEIYLPPVDNSNAYYDLSDNYTEIPCYNMSLVEGKETADNAEKNYNALDEIDVDYNNIQAAELIFLDGFDTDIQTALPDINLQDIFLDPQIMNVKEKKSEKMPKKSEFTLRENEMMFYLNKPPVKERRYKYSGRHRGKPGRRRKNARLPA